MLAPLGLDDALPASSASITHTANFGKYSRKRVMNIIEQGKFTCIYCGASVNYPYWAARKMTKMKVDCPSCGYPNLVILGE
tara:strand:+ start:1320 stop:1562 length:243 start_codon:yes stop_codon:yes gene_type:complete